MRKWLKTYTGRILLTGIVLAVCLSFAGTVSRAAQSGSGVKGEETRTGRLTITLHSLQTEGSQRKGVKFRIWSVGTVNSYGEPQFDESYGLGEYPESGEELDRAARKLAAKVTGDPLAEGSTDTAGSVSFSDLAAGIYLVTAAEGNPYGKIAPFLVHLPAWDSEKNGTGAFEWEIQAEPKASPYPPKPEQPEKPDKPEKPEKPNKPDKPKKPGLVQTGDAAEQELYSALLAGSIFLCGAVLYGEKRRKGRENA